MSSNPLDVPTDDRKGAERPAGRRRRRRTKVRFGPLEGPTRWLMKWAGPAALKLYLGTTRLDVHRDPAAARLERLRKPVIYAFWHAHLLIPAFFYRGRDVRILISTAREGEYVARLADGLGFVTLRGSTTRGGRAGLAEMARAARAGHSLAITPDGPQGPRNRVQPGVVALARLARAPILPCGIATRDYWAMPSWDRFRVPKPFTLTVGRIGAPISIPGRVGKADVDVWCKRIERDMNRLTKCAEARLVPIREAPADE